MRTLNEILIANQENQPVSQDEYRCSLEAMRCIEHLVTGDLKKLIDCVVQDKPTAKMRAKFSEGTIERMFKAGKKPPDEWLGPNNIPGSPEQIRRLDLAKKIFEKATGEKL